MQFGTFKTKRGVHIPDCGVNYPTDDPFKRLLKVEVEDSSKGRFQFDETFPYIDESFNYRLNEILGFIVKWVLCAGWNRLHYGLKIKGKKKIRPYKKQFTEGAMCVCNHVYVFDALSVCQALRRYRRMWIPMFPKHFNGKLGWFMRQVGGIPLPETRGGIIKFNQAFDEYHRRKQWFLIFPEAVRWDWYVPIRPFKRGAFSMAYKYDIPVIPTVVTYRERRGLYRLFGKKNQPCVTLNIGEPLFFDKSLTRKEALDKMRDEAHKIMVQMAGIEVNPWPAAPDDEQ